MISEKQSYHLTADTIKKELDNGIIPWASGWRYGPVMPPQQPLAERLAHVESFVEKLDAYIYYYGEDDEIYEPCTACYVGATDTIYMPYPAAFLTPENKRVIVNYYGTLFHVLGYWTGHPERLNRKHGSVYGTKDYAQEHLTAELTSAYSLNMLNITESPVLHHDEYLSEWRKVIDMFEGNTSAITAADIEAGKACAYLFSLQPNST